MRELIRQFSSPLSPYIIDLIKEKRACGFKYEIEVIEFRLLDRFLIEQNHTKISLPRHLVELWCRRRHGESSLNQASRISTVRLIAEYLIRRKVHAYYPPKHSTPIAKSDFSPHIFSHDEISALFKAADELPVIKPTYWYIALFPVVIRLLYSSGLRISEICQLLWRDVDLKEGVIRIRAGKFRKDRLLPLSSSMLEYMKKHAILQTDRSPETPVFPTPNGKTCTRTRFYLCYRAALKQAGIFHGGRGRGPRMHDLRHTFAVHNLERCLRLKDDVNLNLPILADYLGHEELSATQKYLRLIPLIHQEIVTRMENSIGKQIKEYKDETN